MAEPGEFRPAAMAQPSKGPPSRRSPVEIDLVHGVPRGARRGLEGPRRERLPSTDGLAWNQSKGRSGNELSENKAMDRAAIIGTLLRI